MKERERQRERDGDGDEWGLWQKQQPGRVKGAEKGRISSGIWASPQIGKVPQFESEHVWRSLPKKLYIDWTPQRVPPPLDAPVWHWFNPYTISCMFSELNSSPDESAKFTPSSLVCSHLLFSHVHGPHPSLLGSIVTDFS